MASNVRIWQHTTARGDGHACCGCNNMLHANATEYCKTHKMGESTCGNINVILPPAQCFSHLGMLMFKVLQPPILPMCSCSTAHTHSTLTTQHILHSDIALITWQCHSLLQRHSVQGLHEQAASAIWHACPVRCMCSTARGVHK